MNDIWYYVRDGEKIGPISKAKMLELVAMKMLTEKDFVWKNGFDNWIHLEDCKELYMPPELPSMQSDHKLKDLDTNQKVIFIKIGLDRGTKEIEYGPFNLETLIKLYNENRINGKTFVYTKYFKTWRRLASFSDFEEVFNELPPLISEEDKRAFKRKPFIARMFFSNKDELFEGICRDISIGGMQVLVDHFPGQAGERISINVHPENTEHHFVANGEIVRKLEGNHGFSFRFIDLTPEAMEAIQSYISEDE